MGGQKLETNKITFIIMAAGNSSRYKSETGQNKLFLEFRGRSVYEYTLDVVSRVEAHERIIVSQYGEIMQKAAQMGFTVIENGEPGLGISHTIELAMKYVTAQGGTDAAIFFVCDQPLLKQDTIKSLIDTYCAGNAGMVCPRSGERLGNPVLFDKRYFDELMKLKGDKGGKQVLKRHLEDVVYIAADERELADIDSEANLHECLGVPEDSEPIR